MLSVIQNSGPAFVKFGQWAATRTDVFPIEMCGYLSMLHSQARQHLPEESLEAVARAFNQDLSNSFLEVRFCSDVFLIC